MKTFMTFAVVLAAAIPGAAVAQPPDPPPIELGAQISRKIDDPSRGTWTGRITLSLTPLTAIEGTVDIQRNFGNDFGAETSSRGFSGHWRQTLFTSGRWHFFSVLGAGTNRLEQRVPELIIQGRDGPVVIPPYTFINTEFVAHLAPGVQVEIARWLALRGEVRLTVGDNNGGVRGMIGGVVPIGHFRAGDRPIGSTPPVAAWQRVRPGREVWVTTESGALLHGEVAAVSTSTLTLARRDGEVTIRLDEVRLVEGRDSLKNGFLIGAGTGALAGGVLFGWASSVFCESDSCDSLETVAVLLGAASGVAVGGLIGAMVDGIIPGKQSLFEKTGIRVVPMLSPRGKSIGLTIHRR